MGEIQKQSIKGTIYIGLGTAIGFLTNAVIFPRVLQANQIGLISILIAYTVIFTQIGSLGFNNVTTRMFPYFRNKENKHNGFLSLGMMVSLIGFFIAIALFLLLKPLLIQNAANNSELLTKYIDYVIPMVFFMIFYNLFENYYKVLYNAVIGVSLREFIKRIFILISIFFYYYKLVAFKEYILLYVVATSLPTILILFLLIKNGHFNIKSNFSFIKERALGNSMFDVALFGVFASTTSIITLQIDRIMIERGLGLTDTGIYTTCFYFGALVLIPSKIMAKISSTFISDAWKNNNLFKIKEIYEKSSLNLFIIGLILLIGVLINLNNIFIFLPKTYIIGKYVIMIIGIASVIDMISGNSIVIISTSKKYRYSTYAQIGYVTLLIISNFILIYYFGIIGAAFATLFSKILYNLYKYLFLKKVYSLNPYNYKFLIILLIGFVSFMFAYFIPQIKLFYIDFLIRSIACIIPYLLLIYVSKVSADINQIIDTSLMKIFKWYRKN